MNQRLLWISLAALLFGFAVGFIAGRHERLPESVPMAPEPAEQAAPDSREAMIENLLERVEGEPDNFSLLETLGNLYFDTEKYADAVIWYDRALKVRPDAVTVIVDRGAAYQRLGDYQAALEDFNRALAIDPAHETALCNKAIVLHFGFSETTAALEILAKVLTGNPANEEARKIQIMIQRHLADTEEP
jgi:tetratricopeptide (TPR) repeat protein